MKRYMIPDEECLPKYFTDEPVADVGGGLPALTPTNNVNAQLHEREYQLLASLREVAELKAKLATPGEAAWIDVNQELPEPGLNVLIISMNYLTHSQHYTAYRSEPMTDSSQTFWRDSHTGAQTIFATHWQPLPTPPEATQ